MWTARGHAELFSLILGVTAAVQDTGTAPGMAGLTGIKVIIGITVVTVTQAGRAMMLTEGAAVIHMIASGAGMTIMISLRLKVHPCCSCPCFDQQPLD